MNTTKLGMLRKKLIIQSAIIRLGFEIQIGMLKPRGKERCSLFADLYTLHITEVENIGSFYLKKGGGVNLSLYMSRWHIVEWRSLILNIGTK